MSSVNAAVAIKGWLHSDDCLCFTEFDAACWFEQASDDEIVALSKCNFGGDYQADEVARFCKDLDYDVNQVLDYCDRKRLGFECHVDPANAVAWVVKNRGKALMDRITAVTDA